MKFLTKAIKLFIRTFGRIIQLSEDSTEYLLSVVFRKQLIGYVDQKYYHEYFHIHKSIEIAKTIHQNENGNILDIEGFGNKIAPDGTEVDKLIRENGFVISDLFPNSKERNQLLEWGIIYINKRLI